MKILFCTNKFEEVSNGPAKFANLILEINERYLEHEIRILTEDVQKSSEKIYRLELRYPRPLALFSHLFRMVQYHRKAQDIRRTDFPFDVLVYNNAFIGLWSALSGLPTIGMINDDNNASKNWKNFRFRYTFIKQFLFKQLERWAVKKHRRIITNSDYLTEYLLKVYPALSGKVSRLFKAIERPDFVKTEDSLSPIPHKIRIIFVKSDYHRGGLQDLIAGMGKLPHFQFCLSVVGPTEVAFPEISEWAKPYSNLKLNFLGVQTQATIFHLLEGADIFCVPSRQEAFGVANLEAIARALPVVSTTAGGIPEVLDQGRAGWLANPGDPDDLARQIERCILETTERLAKVQFGLKHVEQFFVPSMLERFIKILGA